MLNFNNGITAYAFDDTIIQPPDLTDILNQPISSEYKVYPYSSLPIRNINADTYYGTFKYLKFVDQMKITRTDGRPIWDSWGSFGASNIVNYEASIELDTSLMDYDKNGAWFQYRIAKIKNDSKAYIGIQFFDSQTRETYVKYNPSNTIHDLNQNVGSGSHRNHDINPGEEIYDWGSFPLHYVANEKDRAYFYFYGNVFYETDKLGGIYENQFLEKHLSTEFYVSPRSWGNELLLEGDNVVAGYYNDKPIYFSNQQFIAKAENLDNYIKINDEFINLGIDTRVESYTSGHKINIDALTKIELESGSENNYKTYYVAIDNESPQVILNYPNSETNSNYLENTVVNEYNLKHTTINLGVVRDFCEVEFTSLATETFESAVYYYNGQPYNYVSGQPLNTEGSYSVVVTDLLGHSTTINFAVDMQSLKHNLNRLISDKNYKISKWYNVVIPSSYTGRGTYSYASFESALELAINMEIENQVTIYTLEDINDFTQTNLLAPNNEIDIGSYYYYKSRSDPDVFLYYFDENNLNEVIEFYANQLVSEAQYYKPKSTTLINNYGVLDEGMYNNLWNENEEPAFIVNGFIFENLSGDINNKIYYNYQADELEYIQLEYGRTLESQVPNSGLYLIKEVDQVGHETIYFVYIDLNEPVLEVNLKLFGQETVPKIITAGDLPISNELIYYCESFEIININDVDTWWAIELTLPNNQKEYFTHLDSLPNLRTFGGGEYLIKLYDRLNNNFSFKVVVSETTPISTFETSSDGSSFNVNVGGIESFNTLINLNIYKDTKLLNSDEGYDQYPYDEDNEIIYVSTNTLNYSFEATGDYVVELTDKFGRVLTYDYEFRKVYIINKSGVALMASLIAAGVVLLAGLVVGGRSYLVKFRER